MRSRFASWWFLAPALALFLGWQLYPILRVLWLSFTDYQALRHAETGHWVGLANYARAFDDKLLGTTFLRAALFTALFLPGMIFIPMLAAVLIDRVEHPFLAASYRFVLLIPAMIPGPLVFLLWKWLYNYDIGLINHVLVNTLGVCGPGDAPQWLGSPALVFPALVLMEWWWGLGFHTMFFLAGLAGIPKELYEAARVDGAGEWRVFWHVTFPRLRPILLVLVVLRFGSAMALVDEYLIMGGFHRELPTYTWTVYLWDTAFQIGDHHQGYAAAVGWLGALAMLAVVLLLFRVFRSRDG